VGREVGTAVLDHGTPFFLSYAQAGHSSPGTGKARDSDHKAEQFYFDLMDDLGQLISLRTGADLGFMDTRLRGGVTLVPELMQLLGTCQVLVPLLSAPYLSSEWCGKEWHAFSRRTVQRLPGATTAPNQGCIVPVRWAPITFELPKPVGEELIFSPLSTPDPDLPAQYRANGVYGLLRMGQNESYTTIVWQLARHIANIYHNQRLKVRKFRFEDLENIFKSGSHA
jgi:hypothetical protein